MLRCAHRVLQAWSQEQPGRVPTGSPQRARFPPCGSTPAARLAGSGRRAQFLAWGRVSSGHWWLVSLKQAVREHAASLIAEPCELLPVMHSVWPSWVSAGRHGAGDAELPCPRPGLSFRRLVPCWDLSTFRFFLKSLILSL